MGDSFVRHWEEQPDALEDAVGDGREAVVYSGVAVEEPRSHLCER
jgi:hypothetical protein